MTPSLLLAPAFAGSKEGTRHLRAQSLSIPAGLGLPSGLEFREVAKHISGILLAVWGPPHSRDARSNHHYIFYQKQSVVAFALTFHSGKS